MQHLPRYLGASEYIDFRASFCTPEGGAVKTSLDYIAESCLQPPSATLAFCLFVLSTRYTLHLLYTLYSPLYTLYIYFIHCTLHYINCTLHYINCTLHYIYCTFLSTLYTVLYTILTVLYTILTVLYTIYTVLYTI